MVLRPYPLRLVRGSVAALAIGIAIVAICNTILALKDGTSLAASWDDASPIQIAIAGLPYLLLAVAGVGARRAWVTGLVLTAGFWGFYLVIALTDDPGGGANIGLGILMLFSPVPITVVALIALLVQRR